jgi:hypothetical protein
VKMTNNEIIMFSNKNRIPYEMKQFQITMSLHMFSIKSSHNSAHSRMNTQTELHGMDIRYFNHLISSLVGGWVVVR